METYYFKPTSLRIANRLLHNIATNQMLPSTSHIHYIDYSIWTHTTLLIWAKFILPRRYWSSIFKKKPDKASAFGSSFHLDGGTWLH